jgi:hypothetical protein
MRSALLALTLTGCTASPPAILDAVARQLGRLAHAVTLAAPAPPQPGHRLGDFPAQRCVDNPLAPGC